jgi:uncharacterized protein involved in exopolysaccharide biosynthesis
VASNEEIESEASPVDLKLVVNLLAYSVGSVHRHRLVAVIVFAVVFGGTVTFLALMPKTYHVETRLFAQKNSVLAVKADQLMEGPARSAAETVKQRDNLLAIVRQTDLLHEWYKRRAPLAHLKDLVVAAAGKHETAEETLQWMTDVLDKKMNVFSPTEGVIQITIDWPDPVMALRLVDTAQQTYLDARRASEVTAVAEQVAILQSHAADLRTDIDKSVDAIEQLRASRLAKSAASAVAVLPPAPTGASSAPPPAPAGVPPGSAAGSTRPRGQPDPELARLKAAIEGKQRAIGEVEDFRRRHLAELNASLAEKSATYTENHPVIMDLRQTIASLQTESPEVRAMRADLDRLQKEFDAKTEAASVESRVTINPIGGGVAAGTPPPLPGSIIRIEQEPSDERDPEVMYARTQLRDAMDKYSALRAQIETARIEFDTAQAAFKYRYTVIAPPVYPKGPSKPNGFLVTLGGLAAGILLGLISAVAVDLRKGRILATWQIERSLDLPILAEVDVATLAQHKIE